MSGQVTYHLNYFFHHILPTQSFMLYFEVLWGTPTSKFCTLCISTATSFVPQTIPQVRLSILDESALAL